LSAAESDGADLCLGGAGLGAARCGGATGLVLLIGGAVPVEVALVVAAVVAFVVDRTVATWLDEPHPSRPAALSTVAM
jgi:hypothetical protein